MTGLAVFVALVAVLAAIALFLQARTAKQAALERSGELERVRTELESSKADVTAVRADAKERREEASAARAELNAAKKKAFEQADAAKRAGGAVALRLEIEKLTTRVAEARAEATHQSERARSLELAVEKAKAETERRVLAERKPAPPPATLAAPAPTAPSPSAPSAPAGVDPALLELERARAEKAEGKLVEARKRVAELERDVKAVRGRLETEKRIYVVQKGELELANDRHAELRRRYDATRKDHEELLDAVRQAAQEDRRLARVAEGKQGGAGGTPATGEVKPAPGETA